MTVSIDNQSCPTAYDPVAADGVRPRAARAHAVCSSITEPWEPMDRRKFLKAGTILAGSLASSVGLNSISSEMYAKSGAPPAGRNTPAVAEELLDLTEAIIVTPSGLTSREEKAITLLVEEVENRTGIRWPVEHAFPHSSQPVITLATTAHFESMRTSLPFSRTELLAPEGYTLQAESTGRRVFASVVGADERGILFGVGGLLRALRMESGTVFVPNHLKIRTSPKYPLRGHQLGYRPKTNSYDGWTVAMWKQYIRDLIVFGTNAIELIPPRSDDQPSSPHFWLPPQQMMIEMSRLADEYGLDVWIWYPAMDQDYSNPQTVESSLNEWGAIFKALKRIDAVFVPGGDPGRTAPQILFPLLEKQARNLRQYHPKAQMWTSPQGFDAAWMNQFLSLVSRRPAWLSGVVYGPQNPVDLPTLRKQIPQQYPIRLYPDITHSVQCQFPVPDWDVAYALTEGREVINPRPEGYANILRLDLPHSIGFISYSEGCNDDVNKIITSSIAWNPETRVIEILRDYSRYFIGEHAADDFAQGLLSLERNWRGPLLTNESVETTFSQFRSLEAQASPHELLKWRLQQALYRAYYDAYTRRRLIYETDLENQARSVLSQAWRIGWQPMAQTPKDYSDAPDPSIILSEAVQILKKAATAPVAQDLRTRILELGEALYQSVRMQLAVERYKAESVSRGANLDTLDAPLTSGPWLMRQLEAIAATSSKTDQLRSIDELLNRTNPGPGGFYDDLGNFSAGSHLLRGAGSSRDPEFRASTHVGFAYPDPFGDRAPIAWKRWAESLGDAPLKMHYPALDPEAHYKVRVVYSGDQPRRKIRLACASGEEIHPFIQKPWPPKPLEFDVPPAATAHGELTLIWNREPGLGGNGRGCQVSEVWLIKKV